MANLWQFFGLPDPEGPPKKGKDSEKDKIKKLQESEEIIDKTHQENLLDKMIKETKKLATKNDISSGKITDWNGPITPDGEPFHDLAENKWKIHFANTKFANRALRYVTPDELHRLPVNGMIKRLEQGDILIIDLSKLVHMDAQQSACRRMLRDLTNEMGLVIFSLDDEEKLLLLPGKDIVVDVDKHKLGVSSISA